MVRHMVLRPRGLEYLWLCGWCYRVRDRGHRVSGRGELKLRTAEHCVGGSSIS